MAIYAIADLHLSLGTNKPMDVFNGWRDYVVKLEKNWREVISENDTVVIAGDISWAMHLNECEKDFEFLNNLPGQKILIKGNHDYWWCTRKKIETFLEEKNYNTINILYNNSIIVNNKAICGTRSWLFEDDEQDEKIAGREKGRLVASIEHAIKQKMNSENTYDEIIVFLHYPPLSKDFMSKDIIEALKVYNVKRCFYGHLHGASIQHAVQGIKEGIYYKLISADALNFCPICVQK